jgi:hypothetical protein
MRKLCIIVVAAAVLVSWVGTANATTYGTLQATWNGVDSGTLAYNVVSPHNGGGILVGRYSLIGTAQNTTAGVSANLTGLLPIYCIDTYEWALSGSISYTVADLADGPMGHGAPAMGPTKAAYLKDLLFHYFTVANDASKKAAFAAAVWEIVYETSAWDVSNGVMSVGLTATEKNLANGWLSTLESDFDHGNTAYALLKDGGQDYAIALGGGLDEPPPIPEPLTLLAVFGGVAGVGGYIRRRKLALA